MTKQIEVLDVTLHSKLRKKRTYNYQHVKNQQMVPVNMNEFSDAGTCFPLLFVKHRKNAELFPVALFGFENNENLFYLEGGWNCTYTPSVTRSNPFSIVPINPSSKSNEWKIGIDVNSYNLSENEGESLFENGSPSHFLEAISKQLIENAHAQAMTAQFVNYLVKNNLIHAIKFSLTYANDEVKQIDGIYTIDELALETLSPEQVQELYIKGYFKAIYNMLGSRHNLYELIRRKRDSKEDAVSSLVIIDNQNQFVA
jgi:hypothetical protein